jgi:hypothetical protein
VGLALDEPHEGDRREEVDGITFVVSQRDAAMILNRGHLTVDWADVEWRRGYRVRVSTGGC